MSSWKSDLLDLYLREIREIDLLTAEEEKALAAVKDPEAIKKLTESNLRLVVSVAMRYTGSGMDLLDLIQEGNIGLIKAVKKYDPKYDNRFASYAVYYIKQEIQRAINNQGRAIRIPEHMINQMKRMSRVRADLQLKLGRNPTPEEIAKKMKLTVNEILEMRLLQLPIGSLDTPLSSDENKDMTLADVIPDQDPLPLDVIITAALGDQLQDALNLDVISERERKILMLRYGVEDGTKHTLKEVSDQIGVTPARIRRIEQEAIRKLQEAPAVKRIFGKEGS